MQCYFKWIRIHLFNLKAPIYLWLKYENKKFENNCTVLNNEKFANSTWDRNKCFSILICVMSSLSLSISWPSMLITLFIDLSMLIVRPCRYALCSIEYEAHCVVLCKAYCVYNYCTVYARITNDTSAAIHMYCSVTISSKKNTPTYSYFYNLHL